MTSTKTDPRLEGLDGFRVEIDAARERADVVLCRPPMNVIQMPQRDQLPPAHRHRASPSTTNPSGCVWVEHT